MCQVGLTECVGVADCNEALELQLNNANEKNKYFFNPRDFRLTCITHVS